MTYREWLGLARASILMWHGKDDPRLQLIDDLLAEDEEDFHFFSADEEFTALSHRVAPKTRQNPASTGLTCSSCQQHYDKIVIISEAWGDMWSHEVGLCEHCLDNARDLLKPATPAPRKRR